MLSPSGRDVSTVEHGSLGQFLDGVSFRVHMHAMINIIVTKLEKAARLELNGERLVIPGDLAELLKLGSSLKPGDTLVVDYAHAELVLLRVKKRVRIAELAAGDVNIMLVESSESPARHMPLNARGQLVNIWPGGFYEESLDEMF